MNEIEIIRRVTSRKHRIMLLCEFLAEYGGRIHQLENVGAGWGAGYHQDRASKELEKAWNHKRRLQEEILAEIITDGEEK